MKNIELVNEPKERTIELLTMELEALKDNEEDEIECGLCMLPQNSVHIARRKCSEDQATELFEEGWRQAISHSHALQTLMCPECIQENTPESRGLN